MASLFLVFLGMIDTAGKGGFFTRWIGRDARRALLWRSMYPMQRTHKSCPARAALSRYAIQCLREGHPHQIANVSGVNQHEIV